jgi:hypothetical protein
LTLIKLKKEIISTDTVEIISESLTDDLKPITFGKLACIMNNNILLDIQEVTTGKNIFIFNSSDIFESNKEQVLRFEYSGSYQAEKKSVSTIVSFNNIDNQKIEAEIVADDYYAKRGEKYKFTSYLDTADEILIEGKAILKMDNKTLYQTEIIDNKAEIEHEITNMILDEHVMSWKYETNQGTFSTSSVLYLSPKTSVVSTEYYENKGVTNEVRELLNGNNIKTNTKSEKNFFNKIKQMFGE